ncbi:MAG: DUF4382 domain-containing protein [Colwellia sp.]|nr:DUF4382 domain-containing protein [Colwellia sp.]
MKYYYTTTLLSFLLISCGGGSSSGDTPTTIEPTSVPLVSFSISDAPSDSVTSVNVTFSSITLKSDNDDDDDNSGLDIPILDDEGNPTTMTIDLMDYQDGDEQLIISNIELAVGNYKSLVLNTSGCPQNQNGSTEFCWVTDSNGIKPLKTPSNKLKLGEFSISTESEQVYTIEFNLRSSMTKTAGGASYNLKPHGIRIVNGAEVGSLNGIVDVNLLTSGDECEMVFEEDTDHGKVVYLYQGDIVLDVVMGDEFAPDEALNEIPKNVVMPYASDSISFDIDTDIYSYAFAHLPTGSYTVAFSCSAVGDDSVEYNGITISNPSDQQHIVTINANVELVSNFTEN